MERICSVSQLFYICGPLPLHQLESSMRPHVEYIYVCTQCWAIDCQGWPMAIKCTLDPLLLLLPLWTSKKAPEPLSTLSVFLAVISYLTKTLDVQILLWEWTFYDFNSLVYKILIKMTSTFFFQYWLHFFCWYFFE